MPLTQQQLSNLRTIADAAMSCEMTIGVPSDFTTAQCVLESSWLTIKPGWNCFGIKDYPGSFGRQLLLTREWFTDKELAWFLHLGDQRSATPVLVTSDTPLRPDGRKEYRVYDWFATFPSLTACFAKRASLFTHGSYLPLLIAYTGDRNFDAYLRGVARVYATSPKYADVLLSIIRMPEVVEALDDARESIGRQKA